MWWYIPRIIINMYLRTNIYLRNEENSILHCIQLTDQLIEKRYSKRVTDIQVASGLSMAKNYHNHYIFIIKLHYRFLGTKST